MRRGEFALILKPGRAWRGLGDGGAGRRRKHAEELAPPIAVELIAVLVAVADGRPKVMTINDGLALPSGPFEVGHRSLQSGLRAWVERQTRHPLGYVEQLYTFADRDRRGGADGARAISISYLGLTRAEDAAAPHAGWRDWYDYFPWEDHRAGAPRLIGESARAELARMGGQRARSGDASGRAGGAPPSPSASRARVGTRSWCCSATSCCSRRASSRSSRRQARQIDAPRRRRAAR